MAYSHFMNDDPDTTSAISPLFDTSELKTLDAGQGARLTDRSNAHVAADRAREGAERRTASKKRLTGKHAPRYAKHGSKKTQISGRQVAILAVIVVAVLVAVYFGVQAALDSIEWGDGTADEEVAAPVEQRVVQTDVDDVVTVNGLNYQLAQGEDGTWSVVYEGSSEMVFELAGTPVALIVYNGAIVVPENLDDGTWDVMAFTVSASSQATQVVDADDSPVGGQGSITEATLDGSILHVTDSTGTTTDVALG